MIELRNVTKYYETKHERKYILDNASFTIPSHRNVGILGRNGAGKSTLLRMLGGIDFPKSGTIQSPHSFSWPMGLGGGFQGSMTGRQNVQFVCRIHGTSAYEVKEAIAFVQEFSELGEYFDMPIKTYSSGMKSRLGFGLSLFFNFDYLIIDETLSVGDKNFQEKSKKALRKKIETCNILLVSHSMPILKELCDAGIVLDQGKMEFFEKIEDAIDAYERLNR
jgi:capsular polysaccharide transport system ATP-binding protein